MTVNIYDLNNKNYIISFLKFILIHNARLQGWDITELSNNRYQLTRNINSNNLTLLETLQTLQIIN